MKVVDAGDRLGTSSEATGSAEVQFAQVLENFQAGNKDDPFVLIQEFKSISAQKALKVANQMGEAPDLETRLEFENWDLETRLWNLVETLYSYRLSKESQEEPIPEYKFSSFHVKRENWLRQNPKIKELSLIIYWLQENSKTISISDEKVETNGKWQNTRIKISNNDLSALTGKNDQTLIDNLDSDAPLRSDKDIDPQDDSVDSKNFSLIYKLVIANRIEEAIDLANSTGNFTLALILLGAKQDYIDPIVDKETLLNKESDMLVDVSGLENSEEVASGLKHKLLWIKTVYKLSQLPNLNPYEKLIYKFLSGNDISNNLKAASLNWEEHLLLYLNQLFMHNLQTFITSRLSPQEQEQENLAFPVINPQFNTINGILNSLLLADNEISEQSTHPIRIILGSLMIDQVPQFLSNSVKSITKSPDALINQFLSRIIIHLAIFLLYVDNTVLLAGKTITKLITFYISKLQSGGYNSQIPIYLSFIPDEKDARECYSLFLSTIVDPEERAKQIRLVKRFGKFNNNHNTITDESSATTTSTEDFVENEDKIVNVFRRTVERVMNETEKYYTPTNQISIDSYGSDESEINSIDLKVFNAVEWFYGSNMYEDAILSSLVVIRRFLLTGRLSSLKHFARGKDFKALIKSYDADFYTKSLGSNDFVSSITDESKEELLQYSSLVEGLQFLDDWTSFLTNNKINGSSQRLFWQSPDIEKSIEKVTSKINGLIIQWFKDLIQSTNLDEKEKSIFDEIRSIYVPYLIMELIKIYEVARYRDWKYIKKAFKLISDVANEEENDYLKCFLRCGRLNEFVKRSGELAVVASERGINGIFPKSNQKLEI